MNETISLQDFVDQFGVTVDNCDGFNAAQIEKINEMAWEECAWIATLTHDRAKQALERASKSFVVAELG